MMYSTPLCSKKYHPQFVMGEPMRAASHLELVTVNVLSLWTGLHMVNHGATRVLIGLRRRLSGAGAQVMHSIYMYTIKYASMYIGSSC